MPVSIVNKAVVHVQLLHVLLIVSQSMSLLVVWCAMM